MTGSISCDVRHIAPWTIVVNCTYEIAKDFSLKRKYQLPALSLEEKLYFEYLLLDEIDKQRWYAIVYLELWKSEGVICTQ